MLADTSHDRCRSRISERIGRQDVCTIDGDPQLPEIGARARHGERRILRELSRHPGGNERLAGSDGTVVDLDAMRSHRFGQTVPWFFGTEPIPL